MASRYGPRAAGTDGSDFRHRQRIASHYRDSVINKYRLKVTLLLHALLLLLVFCKLVLHALQTLNVGADLLPSVDLPSTYFWEYWWMCSCVAVLTTLSAIPKNNAARIRRAYFLLLFLGLLPITIAAGLNFPQLMHYSKHGESAEYFHGFPVIILSYIFFTIAFQVHVFTMFFTTKLAMAWQPSIGSGGHANVSGSSQKLHES